MSGKSTGPREGDVLAGKYRVDRVLGAGGMGVVVAAHHLGLDTKVAIKLLLPEMLQHQDVVARFAREARASAKITNEHVARVFDVGVLEDGAPYLVMEFLDGVDLQQWLQHEGPLAFDQAVDFVLQACEAVAEAHELGIVHRDLKPANLFCIKRADAPFIKVLDFGISKVTAAGGSLSMTRTSALMGTPFYMSPEQLESARDVDGRSDVWTFGVILFELISGCVPFGGTTLPEVCIKIATHPPPPIRNLKPDVPEGLQAAILKCLEKDRNKRFATVGDLAAALAPFASSRSRDAVGRLTRDAQRPYVPSGTVSAAPWKQSPPSLGPETLGALGHTHGAGTWLSASRGKLLLGAAAVVMGASVAAIVVFSGGRPAPAPTSVAALAPATAPTPIATVPTKLAPEDVGDGSVDSLPIHPKPGSYAETPAEATLDGQRGDPRGAASKTRRSASPSPGAASKPAGTNSRSSPEPATTSNAFDERL